MDNKGSSLKDRAGKKWIKSTSEGHCYDAIKGKVLFFTSNGNDLCKHRVITATDVVPCYTHADWVPTGSLLLLLLLASNLLLCKSVASLPICPSGAVNCQVSLRDLFDRAVILSHYIHNLSSEMFNEFDKRYAQGRGFITKAINSCHTSSLSTPEDKEQAQQIHHEDLLNLVLRVLRSWNDPLYHLVAEVRGMQEAPEAILSKAIEIEEQNRRLLEGMEKIVGQVHPGIKENEVYSVWSGLPSLQMADEDSRLFAFYNLLHCLRRDSHKIDNYLKLLKCRMVYDSNC